jgi:hypothetical protein
METVVSKSTTAFVYLWNHPAATVKHYVDGAVVGSFVTEYVFAETHLRTRLREGFSIVSPLAQVA